MHIQVRHWLVHVVRLLSCSITTHRESKHRNHKRLLANLLVVINRNFTWSSNASSYSSHSNHLDFSSGWLKLTSQMRSRYHLLLHHCDQHPEDTTAISQYSAKDIYSTSNHKELDSNLKFCFFWGGGGREDF